MGSSNTSTTSTSQATATPEEKALNQMTLERLQYNAPMQKQMDTSMYGAMNTILSGQTLPGNLQGITGINDKQTDEMVKASLRNIYPQFQNQGILDSGTAIQASLNAASEIRNQNAQFNTSALSNLFNQALGGSSNLTNSNNQSTSSLGQQLAGLRTMNSSSSTTSTPSLMSQVGQGVGIIGMAI